VGAVARQGGAAATAEAVAGLVENRKVAQEDTMAAVVTVAQLVAEVLAVETAEAGMAVGARAQVMTGRRVVAQRAAMEEGWAEAEARVVAAWEVVPMVVAAAAVRAGVKGPVRTAAAAAPAARPQEGPEGRMVGAATAGAAVAVKTEVAATAGARAAMKEAAAAVLARAVAVMGTEAAARAREVAAMGTVEARVAAGMVAAEAAVVHP